MAPEQKRDKHRFRPLKPQSKHRVAMASFWRTFHHDGKISPAWRGCTPFILSTITYKIDE